MHVGYAAIMQNPNRQLSDREVYKAELRMAELAEPMGFESIWTVEHHFTDYTMCPDPTQFLSYMAGKTDKALLGSMVIVLPWHDPVRTAEEIALLDNLSDGRFVLGLGRGVGRVEYEGFRLDMNEARGRFVEYAEMILAGLEQGWVEYDGEFIKQPRRDLRPAPFKSFKGRTYAAAVSPTSMPIMAKLGVGLLIIPQKPWSHTEKDITAYSEFYRQENNAEPPPPICTCWTYVDEDADRAEEMATKYIADYWQSAIQHYEFGGDHLKGITGYEYYADGLFDRVSKDGAGKTIDFFTGLMPWGTPEQVYEKIMDIHGKIGMNGFTAVFSYAGMPFDAAERSMKLFADKVLPKLKQVKVPPLSLAKSA